MTHPRLQMKDKRPPEMTATRFFSSICPQVFAARETALRALGGRYLFVVPGEGAWLLDFAQAMIRALNLGDDVEADVAIQIDAPSFSSLMRGTLDVKKALIDARIAVAGNTSLFPNLSAALRPSA